MSTPVWMTSVAPSLADFDRAARQAFDAIPTELRGRCGDLIIQIEDFADDDTLRELDIDDPMELTGHYQGVDLTQKSVAEPSPEPDLVYLYRRPILDEWAYHGNVTLMELITAVLIHEIGHHFGFSDEDMDVLTGETTAA